MTLRTGRKKSRLEVAVLLGILLAMFGLAIGFAMFVVQFQSATTAYMAANSHWSRAQLGTVFALHRYAHSGEEEDLRTARALIDVPLGGMAARQAMEARQLDRQAVRDGLIRGRNDPEMIAGMIWLYRNFARMPRLREAVTVWQESDEHIMELAELANLMESLQPLSEPVRDELLQRLSLANLRSRDLSDRFVGAFTDATVWARQVLTLSAIVVLLVLFLIGFLVGYRLVCLINDSQRRYRAIFEQAGVGMAELTEDGRFNRVNSALCEILGYPRRTLLNLRYKDVAHPEDRDIGFEKARDLLDDQHRDITLEHRFIRGDGGLVWGRLTATALARQRGASETCILVLEDISESHRLSLELSYQAAHDSLTGLFNRRSLERRLASALHDVRQQGSSFALCFIDLDEFKVVNDTCGHAAGDQLLREVADLLRGQLREGDLLARSGGDEFAVLLEGCDLKTANMVAEKLRKALECFDFTWEERTFTVSCSMGLVPVTADSSDVGAVMRSADIACYLAKEKGRNRIHVTSDDDKQVAQRRGEMEWLSRIRAALNEDRLYLDAQYIAPLQGDEELRYEVLVRLIDEDGNSVPPGAFLSPAERFGSIQEIDRWVIQQVCRTLADSSAHLQRLGASHINISGRSFDRPEFQDYVLKTLRHFAIPPGKICFELTETAAITNLSDAVRFMNVLGREGCRFALDDFGAGLSSFGYLRRLPVDFLKIDGIFVRNLVEDETDLAMVRAINEIGQTLNKRTIAEFVETDQARELLQKMGVHYGQGFGIHRPERHEMLIRKSCGC